MSGGPPRPVAPPEVPDEFAAAYREAYERALREQTDAPRHRRPAVDRPDAVGPTATAPTVPTEAPASDEPVETPDVDLPERQGRLVVGTHRAEAVADLEDTWFDQLRDSRLFVPVLLMALAALLVLGAYVLGRVFSAAVGG